MSNRNLQTQPVLTKMQNLVDEGSYFVANNAQTGIAMTAGATFSATAPFLVVDNNNPAASGGSAGVNIALDYLALVASAAGGAGSTLSYLAMAVYIDSIKRYQSGGSQLTGSSPNMNLGATSNAVIHAGAVTAAAASSGVRAIVGQRNVRPAVSATVACVVGDSFILDFGSLEGGVGGSVTVASPQSIALSLPPLIIGPQQSALIYLWLQGATTPSAASFLTELGYWER
jgi:hypothetical protein